MRSAFASKMSYFILTFIFLIITASFLFSSFDNFSMGSSKNVATVDGTPISTREYQTAISRQLEFYNQMMGGSGLTQKQIEQMGVKQSVLNGLIQQKLVLNAADAIGFSVSLDEIKNEIRNLPYFKTNNQFDVNLYRNVLQSNGYVPAQFEELVGNDLKQKKIEEIINNSMLSENYIKDVMEFKNKSVSVQGVKIGRQALTPLVSVSEQEVKNYLSNPDNQKALQDTYSENLVKYVRPEELKAKHILLTGQDEKTLQKAKDLRSKLNSQNFAAIASKETEDPTGKNKGGEIGWFPRGRMVPEFEDVAFKMKKGEISAPVKTQFGYHIIMVEDKKDPNSKTLESVKPELAKMIIQRTKAQDLDKILETEKKQLEDALKRNDVATVEAKAKKVEGVFFKSETVNQFEQNLNQSNLSPQELDALFKAAPGSVLNFGNPGTIYLVKVLGQSNDAVKSKDQNLKTEQTNLSQVYVRKLREELLRDLSNRAKVVTNPSLM